MDEHTKARVGVVAFGFGEPATSQVNKVIAVHASKVAVREEAVVVLTDRDVSPNLYLDGIAFKQIDLGRKPTTYRLAKMAIEQAREQQLKTLIVVTVPQHTSRCVRDLGWVADEQMVDVSIEPRPVQKMNYDKNALTFYTRTPWLWWPLEVCYRMLSSLFPNLYRKARG